MDGIPGIPGRTGPPGKKVGNFNSLGSIIKITHLCMTDFSGWKCMATCCFATSLVGSTFMSEGY